MRKLLVVLIACISFWSCSTSPNNNGGNNTDVVAEAPSNFSAVALDDTPQAILSAATLNTMQANFSRAALDTIQANISNLPSVTICNQIWTTKNLDVSTYRNGDIIPQVTDPTQWANLTTGAWCYYNNDTANGHIYGKLYNWYAVNDPRGLAPKGWHVPSGSEWATLENCLVGSSVKKIRREFVGIAMKEAGNTHWIYSNSHIATNSSGFTGLPGGLRINDGTFDSIGGSGNWWSSSECYTNRARAWFCFLNYSGSNVTIFHRIKSEGYSVRCLRD